MAKSKKDPKRRRRLGLVKVDEVSLVDKPAVPQATYTIVKRDASGDGEFLIDLNARSDESKSDASVDRVLSKADNPAVRQALATAIQSLRSVADQLDVDGLSMLQSLLYCGKRYCFGTGSLMSSCPTSSDPSNYNGIVDDLYEEVTKSSGEDDGGFDIATELSLVKQQVEILCDAVLEKSLPTDIASPAAAGSVSSPRPVDIDLPGVVLDKSTDTETLEEQVNREFQRRAAERAKAAEAEREAKLLKSIESMNQQLEDTLSRADKIQREIAKARGKVIDE